MTAQVASTALLVVIAAVGTVLLAPSTYSALRARAIVDVPNERSSHSVTTVRGGGLACLGGLLVAWALGALLGLDLPHLGLAVACVMSLVGLADDLWHLPVTHRLVAQVVLGAGLGLVLGGPATMLLGAIVFPVVVNAVNFMDGINGMTCLTVVAWASVVVITQVASTSGVSVIAALALGSALGFLPWNVPHARMFLGDTGSYLFGALIATAVLVSHSSSGPFWLILAPMTLYLFDTGYTLARRAAHREPLWTAHRGHLYQRIGAARHWTHVTVAGSVAVLSLVVGGIAATFAMIPAAFGIVVVLVAYTRLVTPRPRHLAKRRA